MPKIADSLDEFSSNLVYGKAMEFNQQGEWTVPGAFKRIIYWLPWLKNQLLEETTRQFIKAIDELEKEKIYFSKCSSGADPKTASQRRKTGQFISVGELLCERYGNNHSSTLITLKQRIEGLKYRIEASNFGMAPLGKQEISEENGQLQFLLEQAAAWKRAQLYPEEDKPLSELDKANLRKAIRYNTFIPLLYQDSQLKDAFFKWVIRDLHKAKEFIQYPATCESLHRQYIEPRLAHSGGLRIVKKDSKKNPTITKKTLTLPFYLESGQPPTQLSILNPNKRVRLAGCDEERTVQEIFDTFRRKNEGIGDVEYFGGFEYYTCDSPPVNLEGDDLIYQMKTIRQYTFEELKLAYDLPQLNFGQWVKIYRATRDTMELRVDGCHAYIEIAVPNDQGGYDIKSCGVLAAQYPKTWWDRVCFLANTVFGKLYSPDDNFAMLTRQHCAAPYILEDESDNNELQEQVRRLFTQGQNNRLVFQVGGDHNCAAKVQREFFSRKERLPDDNGKVKNLFQVKFIKTTPMQPMGFLFKIFRKGPEALQSLFIKLLEIIFGGYRALHIEDGEGRRVSRSLSTSDFHDTHKVYVPSLLFKKIEAGKVPGVIWLGPDPLRCKVKHANRLQG